MTSFGADDVPDPTRSGRSSPVVGRSGLGSHCGPRGSKRPITFKKSKMELFESVESKNREYI